ncbi:hypothetical protein VMCG_06848 [Cytospora schulzeri]|uniref:Uncharacterized protein n=1 Tax=Cytospora schulzeri TaxID=448051 RepID=A0A423W229_9PEZI|nr:hypothetical protein VMCG_06848 [Valsa malicola]
MVYRSPSSPESPGSTSDSPSTPGEDYKLSDENDEAIYEKLVANIKNLVIDSPCVDDLEDHGVPLELYIHRFLEQVCNHKDAKVQSHAASLSIRTIPVQTCSPGANVGNSRIPTGVGHKGNGGHNKRKNGDNSGSGRGGRDPDKEKPYDDGGDDFEDDTERGKRQKTGNDDGVRSCPFRKRNPGRFNVRDYPQCALTSFTNLALLKRSFQDEDKLAEHQRNDERCEVAPDPDVENDPEIGITSEISQKLTERGKTKVNSWKDIWRLLFPSDQFVPNSNYEPPIELDEVQDKFYDERNIISFLECKVPVWHDEVPTGEHGYHYITEIIGQSRDEHGHVRSMARLERDKEFLGKVHVQAVSRSHPVQPPAQQVQPNTPFSVTRFSSDPITNSPDILAGYNDNHLSCDNEVLSAAAQPPPVEQTISQYISGPNGVPDAPLGSFLQNSYPVNNDLWEDSTGSKLVSESSGGIDSAYETLKGDQGGGGGEANDQCDISHPPTLDPFEVGLTHGGDDSTWFGDQYIGWIPDSQ